MVDNKCLVSLFRFDCTVVGQTVTDCFRCLQYHRKQLTKGMTMMAEIADLLAWDCVYNWYPKDANDEGGPRSYLLPTAGESREQVFRNEPNRLHMHAMVDLFSNNNDEPRSQTTSSSSLLFTNREEDSMTTSGSVREQKGGGTENLTSLQHQQITI